MIPASQNVKKVFIKGQEYEKENGQQIKNVNEN